MLSGTDEFRAKAEQLRSLRSRIDKLPDRLEILGAVRAEVEPAPHPPEPPPRHGELIAEALRLLNDSGLASAEAVELRSLFLDPD